MKTFRECMNVFFPFLFSSSSSGEINTPLQPIRAIKFPIKTCVAFSGTKKNQVPPTYERANFAFCVAKF